MSGLKTDLPYLQDLTFWLQKDENLKRFFTEKSFFMPRNDLISAIENAIKSNCPAPRALWILPADTTAAPVNTINCKSPGLHTFHIVIMVQCARDNFQVIKKNDDVYLGGPFMELAEIRACVKESIRAFAKDNTSKISRAYEKIAWRGDQPLFPSEEGYIVSSTEYEIVIF